MRARRRAGSREDDALARRRRGGTRTRLQGVDDETGRGRGPVRVRGPRRPARSRARGAARDAARTAGRCAAGRTAPRTSQRHTARRAQPSQSRSSAPCVYWRPSAPLVLAVDDLQWLDSTSALVLSFAWRRIRDERVGLLVARRSGEPVLCRARRGGDGSARRPAAEPRRRAWPAPVADRSRSPPPDAAANLRRGGRQRVLRARAGARASAARSDSGPGRRAARAR